VVDPRPWLIALLVAVSLALVALTVFRAKGSDWSARWQAYRARTADQLARTRQDTDLERFLVRQRQIAAVGAGFGLILGNAIADRLFLAALFGAVAWTGMGATLTVRTRRYMQRFQDQMPSMVSTVANAVKAGQSVMQALETVVEEFDDPVRAEVSEVIQDLRVGVALDIATRNWLARMPDEDLEIFGTAIILQRQTGGNLAEILENLAATMRERRKLLGQIRSLTTQGRMSGNILSALPAGLYCLLYVLMPERMGVLFTHPLGWAMLALCVGMVALGGYVIRRIVTIDV